MIQKYFQSLIAKIFKFNLSFNISKIFLKLNFQIFQILFTSFNISKYF